MLLDTISQKGVHLLVGKLSSTSLHFYFNQHIEKRLPKLFSKLKIFFFFFFFFFLLIPIILLLSYFWKNTSQWYLMRSERHTLTMLDTNFSNNVSLLAQVLCSIFILLINKVERFPKHSRCLSIIGAKLVFETLL